MPTNKGIVCASFALFFSLSHSHNLFVSEQRWHYFFFCGGFEEINFTQKPFYPQFSLLYVNKRARCSVIKKSLSLFKIHFLDVIEDKRRNF